MSDESTLAPIGRPDTGQHQGTRPAPKPKRGHAESVILDEEERRAALRLAVEMGFVVRR